jgi:hypothetical protein
MLGQPEAAYFHDHHFWPGQDKADIILFSPHSWYYPYGPYSEAFFIPVSTRCCWGTMFVDLSGFCAFLASSAGDRLERCEEISRHTHIVPQITMSNERQREIRVRIGMRPRAPWQQGDPRSFRTNLHTLAHAALRSHDAFDTLWNRFAKGIIHTDLDADTLTRRKALTPYYSIRRARTREVRYNAERL